LMGRHMHRLMHHHRLDGTAYPVEECRIYQAFRDGRGTHVTDEVYWRADGTPFPVEYWSYPVLRDGQLVGCVVSFLDITERINRENELMLAKQTAEQLSQSAHADLEKLQSQIRGSLDEIGVMTALLQSTELSLEQRGCLEGVATKLQTLLASTSMHAGGRETS
jgi:two-component system, sensor histidine kinase and response regulator